MPPGHIAYMAWSEAVEPIQAAQEATVGKKNYVGSETTPYID